MENVELVQILQTVSSFRASAPFEIFHSHPFFNTSIRRHDNRRMGDLTVFCMGYEIEQTLCGHPGHFSCR